MRQTWGNEVTFGGQAGSRCGSLRMEAKTLSYPTRDRKDPKKTQGEKNVSGLRRGGGSSGARGKRIKHSAN